MLPEIYLPFDGIQSYFSSYLFLLFYQLFKGVEVMIYVLVTNIT